MSDLTLQSTVQLLSGSIIPRLGFGVFESTRAKESTTAALKAGYRKLIAASTVRKCADNIYEL